MAEIDISAQISELLGYYRQRAPEYDAIYAEADPRRPGPIRDVALALIETVRGRDVLEIACGTGFWTAIAAPHARHIVATDAAPEVLAVAARRSLPPERVEFRLIDAYDLTPLREWFEAALALFWLSHVPKALVASFLTGLHAKLLPGAPVFLVDNVYIPAEEGPMIRPPGSADTYANRPIADGTDHRVLKNYYSAAELRALIAPYTAQMQIDVGSTFWWIRYVPEQAERSRQWV